MASIRVVLRTKPNAQNKFPIYLRVTEKRKTAYISTGFYIDEDQWDAKTQRVKKNHPNSTQINSFLVQKLHEATDLYIDLAKAKKANSSVRIKKEIKNPKREIGFIEFSKKYLESLRDRGRYNQLSSDTARVNHFINFIEHQDILFSEIDSAMLKRFDVFLVKTRNLSPTSIRNNQNVIRTIFSRAIEEGIVDEKFFPYGKVKYQIKKTETLKIGLSMEEVVLIEKYNSTPGSYKELARDMWLFSFYFAGIRVGDLLKMRWSDIHDGRLAYTMGKNNKIVHLKIPEKAKLILEKYDNQRSSPDDFIFPPYKQIDYSDGAWVYRVKNRMTNTLNRNLRAIAQELEITKKIHMHISRHTFGNIARDKIPSPTLQKLYRHSNLSTTVGYMGNFIHNDADDALSKVIGE